MDGNRKAPQGRAMGPFQVLRVDRADQPQYSQPDELTQDCEQFVRELQHHRQVTPDSRSCVYRIAASVPFTDPAALRSRGWI